MNEYFRLDELVGAVVVAAQGGSSAAYMRARKELQDDNPERHPRGVETKT